MLGCFVAVCGLSLVVARGLLNALASLVVQYGLQGVQASVVVAHGLSCPLACRIFPGQESNLCALHGQAGSQPLDH